MSTSNATTNAPAQTATTQPYIFFYGRCQEALDFYGRIFGGTSEIMRVKDAPAEYSGGMPGDLVMHAQFTSPILVFQASDGRETKAVDPDEGNVAVSIRINDAADADRICKELSDGGNARWPLSEAFWGGRFANIVDRFGTEWMISAA
jgi:PhnB protein